MQRVKQSDLVNYVTLALCVFLLHSKLPYT